MKTGCGDSVSVQFKRAASSRNGPQAAALGQMFLGPAALAGGLHVENVGGLGGAATLLLEEGRVAGGGACLVLVVGL